MKFLISLEFWHCVKSCFFPSFQIMSQTPTARDEILGQWLVIVSHDIHRLSLYPHHLSRSDLAKNTVKNWAIAEVRFLSFALVEYSTISCLGWTGRLYQRYMLGTKQDCAPIAEALHNCMFWLQRKDVQELVSRAAMESALDVFSFVEKSHHLRRESYHSAKVVVWKQWRLAATYWTTERLECTIAWLGTATGRSHRKTSAETDELVQIFLLYCFWPIYKVEEDSNLRHSFRSICKWAELDDDQRFTTSMRIFLRSMIFKRTFQ